MAIHGKQRTERHGLLGFGLGVYRQVAGVLGAIALAAMLGHLVDVDWRSFLATLVGYWDDYVRPAAKWLLHLVVTTPLRWAFGWHVEVPLVLRDYLAAGVVLAMSTFRAARSSTGNELRRDLPLPSDQMSAGLARYYRRAGQLGRLGILLMRGVLRLFLVLLWPSMFLLGIVAVFLSMLRQSREFALRNTGMEVGTLTQFFQLWVLQIAPLLYFGILLAVNYFIL